MVKSFGLRVKELHSVFFGGHWHGRPSELILGCFLGGGTHIRFSNHTRSQLNENYTIAIFKKALNPNHKLHHLLGGDSTIGLRLLRHLAAVLFHLVVATWSLWFKV